MPVLLALAVHAPVLSHGLLWDDSVVLQRNLPAIDLKGSFAPPTGLAQWPYEYYRPLTVLSFVADRALYGRDPAGYHRTVWILHAVCVGAVYLLGTRILSPHAAALGAALFAVFPLSTESVGWISGRSDVLATLFGVLAAVLVLPAGDLADLVSGRRPPADAADSSGGRGRMPATFWWRLVLSSLSFFAALLSKESAIALLPVLLAAAFLGRLGRKAGAGPKGPDPGMRGLAAGIAAALLPVLLVLLMRRTLNPPGSAGLVATPGTARKAVLCLLDLTARLVFPFSSTPYRPAPSTSLPTMLVAGAAVLAWAALAVLAWRRRRGDRLVLLLWIAATIGAAAAGAAWNISRTPVADRYLYMPSAGWGLLVASLLIGRNGLGGRLRQVPSEPASPDAPSRSRSAAARRSVSRSPAVLVRAVVGWGIVVAFGAATLSRTPIYADDLRFWTAAVTADPSLGAAYINLGNALASGGRLDEARSAYERAIALDLSGADRALATTDLGAALYQSGRDAEAEPLLRRAAAMPEADATAWFNLGAFLYQRALAEVRQNRPSAATPLVAESVSELERTVRLDPHHAGAWLLLGHGRAASGQIDTARAAWRRAVEIDRDETDAGREAAAALARTEPGSAAPDQP